MTDTKTQSPTDAELVRVFRARFDYHPTTGHLCHKGSTAPITEDTSSEGYLRVRVNGTIYGVHRIAWAISHGELPLRIDHKNRVRSDNRLQNLRAATTSQNNMNRPMHRGKGVNLKGVSFHKRSKTYRARIKINKTSHWLGQFACANSAALAYDRAATYFFGEFAMTNFELGLLEASEANHE